MFVRYSFNVKGLLRDTNTTELNSLRVEIENPIKVASDLARRNKFTPPNCPPGVYNGECHVNFLRKMQASFAWDWGLAAPSAGLWKGVQLEIYDMALLRESTVQMTLSDHNWTIRFRVFLETANSSANVKGELEILIPEINNTRVTKSIDARSDEERGLCIEIDVSVPEEHVKLWWPNGFGEQNLYAVNVSFTQKDNGIQLKQDTKRFRIGFRTINLIQEPLGK